MMYSLTPVMLLGFLSTVSSHMYMKTPTPFAASKHAGDNGPLKADGSNYPCKFGYDTEGATNVMPLGSKQELAFVGGATHGGGSCQVSLTYDKAPTASSKFKVIHSIVGGCPARNVAGNIGTSASADDPDKYEFPIPDDLPEGDAVLAWTWFNKVGNREMYMNCAPVKLTSAKAKRDTARNSTLYARGMEAFDALPDMFVANIGNGCTTKDSTDLQFDNPGKSVDIISSSSLSGPVGNCAASAKTSAASNSAPEPDAPKPQSPKESPKESSPNGGAFFTVPPKTEPTLSNSQGQPAAVSNKPDATPEPNAASMVTQAPPAQNSPEATNSNSSTEAGSPMNSPATGSSAQKSAGSPCTSEGAWNCLNGESYQRCASGTWTPVMQLAAGTSCNSGTTEHIVIEAKPRHIARAPRSHLRRHINKIKSV